MQRIGEALSGINSPSLLNRYLHIRATFWRSTCTLETHFSTTWSLLRTHAQDRLAQEIETQVARKIDQPTALVKTVLRLKYYCRCRNTWSRWLIVFWDFVCDKLTPLDWTILSEVSGRLFIICCTIPLSSWCSLTASLQKSACFECIKWSQGKLLKSTFTSFFTMHFIIAVTFSRSLSSIHFRKRASEPGTSEASTSKHAKPDSCVSMSAYWSQVGNFYILVLQAMQALLAYGLVFTKGASTSTSIGARHATFRSDGTGMKMCVNKIETICKKPQLFYLRT